MAKTKQSKNLDLLAALHEKSNSKNVFTDDTSRREEEEADRGKPLHWLRRLQEDGAQHGIWEQAGGALTCLCHPGCLPQGFSPAGIDIKCEGWQNPVECDCFPAVLWLWCMPKALHCCSCSLPSSPYFPCIKRGVARERGKGLWASGSYVGWILYFGFGFRSRIQICPFLSTHIFCGHYACGYVHYFCVYTIMCGKGGRVDGFYVAEDSCNQQHACAPPTTTTSQSF